MPEDDTKRPSIRSKRAQRREVLHAKRSPGHLWPEYDGPEEILIPESVLSDVIFSENRESATTQQ